MYLPISLSLYLLWMTTCSGTVMLYFVFGPAVQLKYTLQIRCDYSDRKSDVIIQWYRSNIKLCQTYDTTSSPCPGCHIECEENLLTIDAVTKDDSGGYQCVVTKPQSPDEWSRVRYVSVNSGITVSSTATPSSLIAISVTPTTALNKIDSNPSIPVGPGLENVTGYGNATATPVGPEKTTDTIKPTEPMANWTSSSTSRDVTTSPPSVTIQTQVTATSKVMINASVPVLNSTRKAGGSTVGPSILLLVLTLVTWGVL